MVEKEVVAGESQPRRPSENGKSAKGLLLDLFGEFVLPDGGRVWTSTLLGAMSALGIEPKTTRQALSRAAKTGAIQSEPQGRRTQWLVTSAGRALLEAGNDRIFKFGIHQEPWDNSWLLLITSVSETDRHLRYRLRTRLAWEGFAPIGLGVWLSPWTSHEIEARETLERLGLAKNAISFVGHPGSIGASENRIHEAWNLRDLQFRYDEFIAWVTATPNPPTDVDAFVALTRLMNVWRKFPIDDPGLPNSLLPRDWNGGLAARTFHSAYKRWSPAAKRWWRALAQISD